MTFETHTDVEPASGGGMSVKLTLWYAYGVVEFLRAVVTDPGTSTYAAGDEYPTDDMSDPCCDWAAWCEDQLR
jgi:hypothetical protein